MENFYETPQMEVMSLELESAILTVSDNTVVGPDPEYPDQWLANALKSGNRQEWPTSNNVEAGHSH